MNRPVENSGHGGSAPGAASLSVNGKRFLAVWSLLLISVFCAAGVLLVSAQHRHRFESAEQQREQVDRAAAERGLTAADPDLPEGSRPTEVTTGIYVERIIALSVKAFEWKVEFYIWFRWEGDQIQLEDRFDVVDGTIESVKKLRQETNGQSHYE